VIQYSSTVAAAERWSSPNERGTFISQFDNVLWTCAPHRGSDSYDVTAGVITALGSINESGSGSNWANSQTETLTHIVRCNHLAGARFFTKTGTGIATFPEAYHYEPTLAFSYIAYNAELDVVVMQRDNGDLHLVNADTLTVIEVISAALPTNGFDDIPYSDASYSNIDKYWKYPRSGNEIEKYFIATGWYTYDGIDPDNISPYDQLVVDTGDVLGWWKCDEPEPNTLLLDYSGNEKDMTINGTYTKPTGLVDGEGGLAYGGDGTGGTVLRNNMGLPTNAEWALEGWIKLDVLPPSLEYMIGWGDAGGAGGQAGGLSINTAGLAYFHVYNTGAVAADTGGVHLSTTRKHHFVVQYTTTQIECWIDGVLIGTNSDTRAVNTGYPSLFLSRPSAAGLAFNGQVDNAVLYNVKLDKVEIEARYALGATYVQGDYETLILSHNPRAYFPLKDFNPQAEFLDISGNGFHAVSNQTNQAQIDGADGGLCAETTGIVGQYMQTATGVLSLSQGDSNYTIEFWLQRAQDEFNSGSNYDLFHRVTYIPNTGTFNHDIAYNYGGWLYSGLGGGVPNINLPDDASGRDWVHHVVTVDVDNSELSWWMNGVLQQRTTGAINSANTDLTCILSNGQSTGYTYPMKGKWQHWAIYDYVLNESEIISHYQELRPVVDMDSDPYAQAVLDTNPSFYWKLDELAGDNYEDTTGNMSLKPYGNTIDNLSDSGLNASNPSQQCVNYDAATYLCSDHTGNVGKFTSLYVDYMMELDVSAQTYQIFVGPIETGGYYMYTNSGKIGSYVYHSAGAGRLALSTHNYFTDEVFHHGLMFDGRKTDLTINGYSIASDDYGSDGYIHYPTYLRYIVGAQFGGTITEHTHGKMAHLVQYTNPAVPPTPEDYRKRFLLAIGYDPDNYTEYQQHVIDDDPLVYFPMDDAITSKRTCAALHFRPNKLGNTCEPDARTYLTGYLRQQAGMTNDGSGCIEYTETTGVNNHILQRGAADFAYAVGDWSFEGWFNLSKVADSGRTTLVSYGGTGGDATALDNILYKFDVLANGSISYIHEYGLGSNEIVTSGAGLFTFNIPQYVVVTRDIIAKEMKMYVNGILVWTWAYTNNPTSGEQGRLKFGSPEGATSQGFIGKVQHLAVHETALSETRIRERYKVGSGIDRWDVADDYAQSVLADFPTHYYRMNDPLLSTKLVDIFNEDAYVNTGVLGLQEDAGLVNADDNKGVFFDGSTEVFMGEVIPDNPSELSIEFRFKLNSATDSVAFVRGRDGQGAGWSISYTCNNDTISFGFVTISPSVVGYAVDADVLIELGVWHHTAVVWDFGTGITIYLDGVPIKTDPNTSSVLRSSTFTSSLGTSTQGATFHTGYMDELAIYDSLLTPQSIMDRYIDGIGERDTFKHEVMQSGPSIWWDMDRTEKAGGVVEWISGNDGTFTNNAARQAYPIVKGYDDSINFPDYNDYSSIDCGDINSPTLFNNIICGELWFQWDLETYTTGERVLFQDGGTTRGWSIAFYNGDFGVWVRNNGVLYFAVIPHNEVPLGQRNQVGWVINNGLWLYLNGNLVANTTSLTLNDFNGSAGTIIGGLPASGQGTASGDTNTSSQSMEGSVSQVILYDNILSTADFKTHWDAGKLGSNYLTTVMELGAIIWYRMDDALDGSSQIYDAINGKAADSNTGIGNTLPTFLPIGGYNVGGYDFDGVADAFRLDGTTASDLLNFNKEWTASAWVNPTTISANDTILARVNSTSEKQIWIRLTATGQVEYSYEQAGNSAPAMTTVETIPTGSWSLITVTCSGASDGYINIYINGVITSVSAALRISQTTDTTNALTMGRAAGPYNDFFYNGVMDEVMWFNRELSSTEVATLYNATADEYQITGTVTEDETGVQRVVRVYRRDNGALVRDLVSEPDGTFDIRWRELDDSDEYFVIAFDDDNLPNLEAIARDRLTPNVVT
jgi:hypothetical protein